MNKIMLLMILGTTLFSSCRKDYECVDSNGNVLSTCNNCRSRGAIKVAFDADCTFEGGTVQVK